MLETAGLLTAAPASSSAGGGPPARLPTRSVAARALLAVAVCGAAAWLLLASRSGRLGSRRTPALVDLPGQPAAALLQAYDKAQMEAVCEESFTGQPCCWTKAWSCPGEELGAKGAAVNDGTMAFHCCCVKGRFVLASDANCSHELLPKTIRLPSDEHLWGQERAAPEAGLAGSCTEEVGKQLRGEFDKKDEPAMCKIPVEKYPEHQEVLSLCRAQPRWQELAKIIRPRKCDVDPETHLMTCTRDDWCHGGEYVAERYPKLTKNLTYDCGSACEGSLLIACCDTCMDSQRSAAKWDVDNIICKGCDVPSLQAATTGSPDCTEEEGMFHCDSTAECSAGDPSETCEEVHYTCDVFPCDRCDVPHLQAQCCADCLSMMCAGVPDRRLMCQGCANAPNDEAWWQGLR